MTSYPELSERYSAKMAEGGESFEMQIKQIITLLKSQPVKGETWYLVDQKWMKQWKKYVGYDPWDSNSVGEEAFHPGPVDNEPLFREDNSKEIRDNMIEDLDFLLLPAEAWNLFMKWYGLADGQEPIARTVVEFGMFVKHCKVEVYLFDFKLCENSNLDRVVSRKFSKVDTIERIEQEMRTLFNIPEDKETRLWNKYNSNTYEYLSNKQSTVQDAGLYPGQVLIIEQKNDDSTWPRQTRNTSSALTYSSTSSNTEGRLYGTSSNAMATRSYGSSIGGGYGGGSSYNYDYHNGTSGATQPGRCGLSNLGNTCFMNAALQCMSNSPPLTEYFLGDRYWDEVNVENPLGMHGEIAKAYAELIKVMWSGRCNYTLPRNFKTEVGRFAPQFSGYQQQDCQELMAFLLDGLHEDLNRVKKKPYVELRDADGRPDEVVAEEAWSNYLKRNNSIIVDTFHGLLKSTLVCPECSKISVTFDPFCYLSLPLPLKKERHQEVVLVFFDPSKKFLKLKLAIPKLGTVQDLCNSVSKLAGIPPDQLMVMDVYNHRFHKIFLMDESVSNILEKDIIFVYEVPVPPHSDSNFLLLPVYMREKKMKQSHNYNVPSFQLFGQPIVVAVPKTGITYDALYANIMKKLSRYVTEPDQSDEWWVETEKVNGEVEMNGDDIGSQTGNSDSDQSTEVQGSSEKADATEDVAADEVEIDDRGARCPPRLFTLQSINNYGSVEIDKLRDDKKPLRLTSRTYLSIDWHPKAKEKFYNEAEAKEMEEHESLSLRLSQKKQVIQLNECLELFTTTEKLGADDPWYCPACKKHQQATKKFDLWSLPRMLIIHLKRFSYNRYWRDKLDILVEFPSSGLNMAKYLINPRHGPAVYDLVAVANHYGGMGGGHYTAYAKNKDTGQWYYFDDGSVNHATEDNVVSRAAYVLFYMRRETNSSSVPGHSSASSRVSKNPSAALGAAPSSEDKENCDDKGSSDEEMDCN